MQIGRMREEIKEAAINEFKSFLVSVRNVSHEIGERALDQVVVGTLQAHMCYFIHVGG